MLSKKIIILTNYKDHFGSKWDAIPYNSGFAKKLLKKYFNQFSYDVDFVQFSEVDKLREVKGIPILYTSSEDIGYHYKDFIEDIVYYLELEEAIVIPKYKFLRANNNKVFMELLRNKLGVKWNDSLRISVFGSADELTSEMKKIRYPVVVKESRGAQSRGVFLAKSEKELKEIARKISRARYIYQDIKDSLRSLIHKNYVKESLYRKKILIQEYIPNLKNDWKILVFGARYFIFYRPVKKGDFRASGSGVTNYRYGSDCKYPNGIFNYAKKIFLSLNVPNLSVDIAYDGNDFYLLEYQAVYFGTVGYTKSDIYFVEENGKWMAKKKTESLEQVYVESVIKFLKEG